MSDLRTAAQQALEALLDDPNKLVQISEHHWESKRDLAVIALRAALAEPVEPVQEQAEQVEQARLDAVVGGVGITLGGKRIDPASIYEQAEKETWIDEIWSIDFARAIEQAHGIGTEVPATLTKPCGSLGEEA